MRKLLSSGLVAFAGVVSLPVAAPFPQVQSVSTPKYGHDPRFVTLRNFFDKFNCPAKQYSDVFLEAADDNALDWRLLPSISYIETTGGKWARNNNLFGWDSGRAQFSTPAAGIHTVGERLANSIRYRSKDLDQILETYNSGVSYARRVKFVMRSIAAVQ